MRNTSRSLTRPKLLLTLISVGALVWIVGQRFQASAAAQGGAAQSNFVGGTTRLRFPKGSRSNWHSHTWGQLLMIEEGKGRTQVRGGPVKEMLPGQPWWTAANVEHWHGAAPDSDALQLTIYEGTVKWLEPVTDQHYMTAPSK